MEYTLTELKDLVTIAKPIIDPIISTIIRPKIDQLAKWIKKAEIKNKVEDNFFENKFEEYLARTYNHCQNINILIFQNQQIKISDIYYPLTIQSSKDHKDYKIEDFPISILENYGKVLISDTAGMGKSTLMKWIGKKIIENHLGIPILIELRNLKDNHSILDEIFNQINPIDKSFDKDLILKFLELGHFIILLDGFDEIQHKNQEIIIKEIRDFINKTHKNYFILTSRPEGALATFGDFQLFHILPLREKDAFEVIKKYDSVCPIKVGDKLIEDIKENFNQTKELLGNPFLVSLIYSTYTYNKDIPSNKVTFYEEIYSALFKRHDLSKDGWTRPKKSKLDIQQFKIVLRQLAFDTAVLGEVIYTESEIINYITNSKSKCPGIEFNVVDFLDDILSSVPIFQRDGSKIKWAHKSLQDYFAADFIAFDSRKQEILNRIYKSDRDGFLNILDLFYEMDYKTFRNVIIKQLLTEFIEHCETSYLDFKGIDEETIKERRAKTFNINITFLNSDDKVPITKVFENIQKKIPEFNDAKKRAMIISLEKIMVVTSFNFKRQLIELLAIKQSAIISHKYEKEKNVNLVLPNKEFYKLDDDPNSYLNKPANFKKVNSLLFYPLQNRTNKNLPVLDYDKAKEELTIIENEIKKEKELDNFKDI